ncbi:D-amino-acid transaminase [Labrys sp. LIt4]|uniref:Probable branched-chain-amino-acid aminotransferase n=1 Tax=Labrys okinawensis TaxID=346911 RepID=A0A2S9QBI7_9HYPH|nr:MULTISPECIES: D-amino-acid transaminase [Labrys]MBP0583144.1 D-amino-acid transaminase [Labrys sp. LIt4]PRH86680.1 D-amino acid aminotransferase [Labrys okinawensis]
MSRIAYVNGIYVPLRDACVHVEDRGFQFADGVYEVCEVFGGRLVDQTRHLARLKRSLSELGIGMPVGEGALKVILRETVRRNRVRDGLVYLQVTRGAAKRDFVFPAPDTPPTLVVTARSVDRSKAEAGAANGISVISLPDNRWERVDIKSTGLLPNALARQRAKERGAKEAWFVDRDGYVTEGAASNAWIITRENTLLTRPAESGILRGVTRTTLLDLARRDNLLVSERPFTLAEAKAAKEAFVTAATALIMPVVRIDDTVIGDGKPGALTARLRARFHEVAERSL